MVILYGVETKRINETVRRNVDKILERFSWQLGADEYINLESQFANSRLNTYGGRRKLSRVFTEQGVAMLATILKTSVKIFMMIHLIVF